jgi:hypothetical protein
MHDWQKTVRERTTLEFCIVSVDESYRITLPKPFCKLVGWISGNEPHKAWLLLDSPGRCRLLSAPELESEHSFQSLQDRIAAELNAPSTDPLEFQDERSATLALRLQPVDIMPRGPGWRLALPRPIAAIMQLRPGESDVAALLLQDHIELWTMETLRSSVSTPLTEII